jgi:hypothetical protein
VHAAASAEQHPKNLFMERRAISPPPHRRDERESSKVFEQNAPTLFFHRPKQNTLRS